MRTGTPLDSPSLASSWPLGRPARALARLSLGTLLALGTGLGCTGQIGAGTPDPGGPGPGTGGSPGGPGPGLDPSTLPGTPNGLSCAKIGKDTGVSTLRRLSNLEYQLTLQDLFQLNAPPALDGIPPDVDLEGFRTVAAIQTVSAQHLRAYIERAHGLADALMTDTARRTKVLGCEPTAATCLRTFVTRFGKLAFRRPLETKEIDSLVTRATADALDATDQFRFAIEVLLSSPTFLYRVEVGNSADAIATLSPVELASRLSFALWGRGPDATQIDQATTALATPDGLAATAATMLADPRAKTFYDAFFRQWLGFEDMQAPPNPPAAWKETLLPDMSRETQQVLNDFAWSDLDFLGVLTADYTRPTAALSTYYGVPTAGADGTAKFPAGHARAGSGVLTHPSLLAAKRDGDLIAMRGNWLRRTFLCSGLTLDPNVAEMLGEILVGLSRVEIVKKRNTETACKGCHALIDPIGVGFAAFDNTGRFDGTANVAQYEIAPALPSPAATAAGTAGFATLAELGAKLQAMPEVKACLATKAFLFAEGRSPERADTCAVEAATTAFAEGGNSFSGMLKGLVTSPAFRTRRPGGVNP